MAIRVKSTRWLGSNLRGDHPWQGGTTYGCHRWSGRTIHGSHRWSGRTIYGNKICRRWSGRTICGGTIGGVTGHHLGAWGQSMLGTECYRENEQIIWYGTTEVSKFFYGSLKAWLSCVCFVTSHNLCSSVRVIAKSGLMALWLCGLMALGFFYYFFL